MIPSFEMRRCAGHRLVAQTWGAVAGAAVGVVGSALTSRGGSQTNGGAGTQTQTKEPWLQAQPWIMNNLSQGQALQNAYQAHPFNDLQNQAFQNQANQSAYMRAAVPSLLGQISAQQVGFDRSNPNARPNAFNFDGLVSAAKAGQDAAQSQGLLSMLQSAPSNVNLNANTPQIPAPAQETSKFTNLNVTNPANAYLAQMLPGGAGIAGTMSPGAEGWLSQIRQQAGGAGYGTWKYGDPLPMPGTQQYRDMQEYFQYGGADPYKLYSGGMRGAGPDGGGPGVSVGDGIGVAGSAASVGSSANF